MARHPYATEAVVEFLRTIDGETELDRISAAFVGQLRRRGFGDFSLRLGNDDAVVIDGRPFHGVSTYSQGWERHFCTRNYFETSPVFRLARVMDRPFNWFELLALPWISKPDKRVFEEAVEFDIGLGITVPIRTRHGESGVFTVTSNPREDPTADVIRSKGETAHLLGFAFFEVAGPLIEERQRRRGLGGIEPALGFANDNAPLLGPSIASWRGKGLTVFERDCLAWGAVGLTDWLISERFRFPEAMVHCALESARIKLGAASRTHALVKALVNDLVAI
jgi:LuxR family quorum sensing-dependent transcriptional regulator